jgi:ABC-type uncharacterized transport system auxiliary subunit
MTAHARSVCIAAVKCFAALAFGLALSGCMTLENRRDLYTADFDRSPVHRTTTTATTVQATTTATETQPVKTRKTAPEVKPIPNEPEETPSLPPPLPPP